ncbi:hypothetical protein LCGC14_2287410 [marine sediment metagenome]|uniref:Uncharacterized protein n=1 Tax=marine sediment metagenome TaxID=412755 RepID=A0A0F9CST7_9ZZZZ
MTYIKFDFYGKNLADYKKAKIILEDIKSLEGCSKANFYLEESVTFAGYSSMIIEWTKDNKEFLVALATLLYMLLKDKKDKWDKVILNKKLEITYKDNPREIKVKLEESYK